MVNMRAFFYLLGALPGAPCDGAGLQELFPVFYFSPLLTSDSFLLTPLLKTCTSCKDTLRASIEPIWYLCDTADATLRER